MDLWQLIARDHENISRLIRDIPYALNGPAVVRSRERMIENLMDELEAHSEALDASLYAHLRRREQTAQLVQDLQREPSTFMKQLGALARHRRKGSQGWLNGFEDASLLVDQYLDRHTRELLPHARELLSSDELEAAKRAFVRSKVKTLKARRGLLGRVGTEEVWLIATVGAIAAGLGFLAWRSRGLRAIGLPYNGTSKGRQFSGGAARASSAGQPRRYLHDNPFSAMFQRVSAEPAGPMGATGAGTLCTFDLKNRSLRRDVLPVIEEANRGWLQHGYQVYLEDRTLTERRDHEADRPALVFQIAGATLPRDLVSAQTFGFCFETDKGGDEVSFTVRDPHSAEGAPWNGPQLDDSKGGELSVEQLHKVLEFALRLALAKPV
ncbi:MAG: hemerythrin domain-containing protein [Methylorubrum extorquens]|uniref:hemerythrin domain-containing protein n=1 Tax=Methylorubrum extorquens TaxID=408 RepID=UPI002FEE47CC